MLKRHKNFRRLALSLLLSAAICAKAQSTFDVIPLGVLGGGDESNLSSYAISAKGENAYVCLDAGTIRSGISKAIANGIWSGDPIVILRRNIKAYLISHPHLDHVSGLILNSPDDTVKQIYGTRLCLDVIRDNYFSWKSWANFGNEGEKPALNKYSYNALVPGQQVLLPGTSLKVTAFILSHASPSESTAFLIEANGNYLLYLGDTGADRIEKSIRLQTLWETIAPYAASGKLKAIFIEVSFPNEQPDHLLFGHLNPKLLMAEMSQLQKQIPGHSLTSIPVVITHMKPVADNEKKIKNELATMNTMGLRIIYPVQGKRLEL